MVAFSMLPRQRLPHYTGVTTYEAIEAAILSRLFTVKQTTSPAQFNENEYVIVKYYNTSALTRHSDGKLLLINQSVLDKATVIRPRNKEQYFALDALVDDSLRVVTLTGTAGAGKSLCAMAAGISLMEQGKYKKLILTRPTSQVGDRELGTLPGTAQEKVMPYLINFVCSLETLFGETLHTSGIDYLFSKYNIEVIPMQLLRGASFNNALIIADETQILTFHEMLTLGTRVSGGSKLIIMGDLDQRDENIAKEQTGLYKFINDERVKASTFTASIHMPKSERGEVASLFTSVFEER